MSDQVDFDRFVRPFAPDIRLVYAKVLVDFSFTMYRLRKPVALAKLLTIKFGVFSPDGNTQWLIYPRSRGWMLRFRTLPELQFAQAHV